MGRKDRALNPADAARREAKKKERQKNKKARSLTREVRGYLEDPATLRQEIRGLEGRKLRDHETGRLAHLRTTLAAIEKLPPRAQDETKKRPAPAPAPGTAPLYTDHSFAAASQKAKDRGITHLPPPPPGPPPRGPPPAYGAWPPGPPPPGPPPPGPPPLGVDGGTGRRPRGPLAVAQVSEDLLRFLPKGVRGAGATGKRTGPMELGGDHAAEKPRGATEVTGTPLAAGAPGRKKRPHDGEGDRGEELRRVRPAYAPISGPTAAPQPSVSSLSSSLGSSVPRPAGARLLPGSYRALSAASVPRPAGARLLPGSQRAPLAPPKPLVAADDDEESSEEDEAPSKATAEDAENASTPGNTEGVLDDFFAEISQLPVAESEE